MALTLSFWIITSILVAGTMGLTIFSIYIYRCGEKNSFLQNLSHEERQEMKAAAGNWRDYQKHHTLRSLQRELDLIKLRKTISQVRADRDQAYNLIRELASGRSEAA
jgi:hypothetical protein